MKTWLDVTIVFMGEDAIVTERSSYHMHHAFMLRRGEKKATDLSSPYSQYICLCNSSLAKTRATHGTWMGKWCLLLNHSKNRLGQIFPRDYAGHFQRYNSFLTFWLLSYLSIWTKCRVWITVITLFSSSSCLNLGRQGEHYCHHLSFSAPCQLSAKHFALKCGKKEMYSWVPSASQLQSQIHDLMRLSKGQHAEFDKQSRLRWALGTPHKNIPQKDIQNPVGILGK